MKLTNPKNGESIESIFASDREAARALAALMASGAVVPTSFVQSMRDAGASGKASPAQSYWVHKLANHNPPKATASFDFAGLRSIFAKAATKLKRPAMVLALPDGDEVKIALAGSASRYPGDLMVSSAAFGGAFYGRITSEGEFFAGRSDCKAVRDLLTELSVDAPAAAAKHGHLSGKCCFCNRKLDTDASTAVGYGPVCADKFGLPWGNKLAAASA